MAKKAAKKKAAKTKAAASKKTTSTRKAPAKKKVVPKKKSVKKKAPAKKAAPKKKAPTKKAVKKKVPAKKATPKKKAPAKKSVKKKAPAKKAAPKKKAPAKKAVKKKAAPKKEAPAKKATPKKKTSSTAAKKKTPVRKRIAAKKRPVISHLSPHPAPSAPSTNKSPKAKKLSASFLKKQKQKLLDLRDTLVDQMNGVARDSLGRGEEGADSSAFGMHQADAGSDSYDREFALNILSQEQDALHEIEEALTRINNGEYGVCQGSGDPIPQARLEAMPFARCTVEYQEQLDREDSAGRFRSPVTSLFGLDDKEIGKSQSQDD